MKPGKTHETPAEGGAWERDPETGELTRKADTPAADADAPGQPEPHPDKHQQEPPRARKSAGGAKE